MSIVPIANRSFLHGERKASATSERILYATLDSLALKGATLPLQLLPINDDNVATERKNESKSKGKNRAEATAKRSGLKVDVETASVATVSLKQHAKCFTMVASPSSSSKPDSQETLTTTPIESPTSVVEQQTRNEDIACLPRVCIDNSDTDVTSIRTTGEGTDSREIARDSNHCSNDGNAASLNSRDELDDYERIEYVLGTLDGCWKEEANEDDKNPGPVDQETASWCRKNVFVKSKSTNDLASRRSDSDARLLDGKSLMGTFSDGELAERFLLGNELPNCEKKKRHFARNIVLHFVPEYLARGQKGKKRQKGKDISSRSLNSLKASSLMDSKIEIVESPDGRYRSRSPSREELKYLKISSPTNFVHVASATNPNLVLNENTIGFSLEQVVIMHEQKCATLPLLVATSREDSMAEKQVGQQPSSWSSSSSISFDTASSIVRKPKEKVTQRSNASFNLEHLKRELLSELQARSAKVLELSQQVKTSEYNQANVQLGELTCESCAELPVNSSFLWSDRTKNFLLENMRSTPDESVENIECSIVDQVYDDVGPVNLINQNDYDDVGTPVLHVDESHISELSAAFQDSNDIYDDVMGPSCAEDACTSNEAEICDSKAKQGSNEPSVANEYSSVDEDIDVASSNDQDVYDDVGLPSEERVNSLYTGSTMGSILGPSWTCGKESEWEDLEDSTTIGLSQFESKYYTCTEAQVVPNKRKSGQRWSQMMRRQRSRMSRKNSNSSSKPVSCESMLHVAVSLGKGSVLLVGCTENVVEWRKEEESDDRAAQQDSQRTQGLVQMRVIDLDEDVDTQETSCYVHEDDTSDDSTYESLHSFQPDDFCTDSETETTMNEATRERESETAEAEQKVAIDSDRLIAYLEAPTRPNPPPPREVSLTRTLGRRIKMLRRTWSITKGSLGRMRKKTTADDDHTCEDNKEFSNVHSNVDGGRYFGFARHFKKSVTGPFSTFYLSDYADSANGNNDSPTSNVEPMYSNTNDEMDHYSVLADQEPLYQFYAAAAARIASDFSSDGYEEIETTIPSRSTTDLVKPGHRTLWCQTPQVINNSLLQRLSTDERKVQEAKFEILTSEASYLNSLRVLKNEFLDETSFNEFLTPAERDKLFGGIPGVLQASEQFLAELETVWRQDPMLHGLPDVLFKYAEKCLDIYVAYCSNQVSIDTTLKNLRMRKGSKFTETVSQIEARSTCQSLSLHSFLMLPMQRITRLPLLADAVLSKLPIEHDDRSHWEKVLSNLSYVVAECNEGASAAAKEIEMENLTRKLEYSAKIKPIALKGKHLVKSGSVVQLSTKTDTEYKLTFGKRFNKTPLYLLLLTDLLLVAKQKSNIHDETYTVIDTCKRSLITLEPVPEDSIFAGRNAMLLTLLENYSGHQVEYILTCESDTERQRWLEAVSPSQHGLPEETLYEVWDCPQVVALYCYSPNQPDELSLHPGDVINVFRKMSDGWYQGEKLLNGEQGWFPGNYTKEVASEHVRAKNLKQRHRFLALNGNVLQRRAKQQSAIH
ncbi:uncharacterized protein LOC122530768 isoform X1 [Frieseomelitta varia]|uniref:uncharacterized protein LOC122530768 isoform X1 n=1 Tax=Frieseomelitta varia TaxID=561572 RepID=UPI001CB69469|nr:uncharacterized protein LOC122530768 isoform X1 [Frieseomelitta varia]